LKARTPLKQARHEVAEAVRAGVGVTTPERLLKTGGPSIVWDDTIRRQKVTQVPLDKLLSCGIISKLQYSAGDRYRADAYLAGIIPSIAVPTEPSERNPQARDYLPGGERRMRAYERWTCAQEALGPEHMPFADEFLVVAECHDTMAEIGARVFGRQPNKMAGAAATEMAKVILNILVRHYKDRDTQGLDR
jgi:hypothetical protein